MKLYKPFCNDLFNYSRFVTREVKVGDIGIGGNNPIRVQSMTTTDTLDTSATVAQSIRMIEAGCELVRITAPSIKEAENLANIKKQLRLAGYNTPLVADIHFTPNAAEIAARIVEKVRINPGNFVDKKKFEQIDYTESEYQAEIDRIRKKFVPLVKICKEYGTAMRIGTNHGSLSDRILSRYGDTPQGMVESAMEFLRIANEENYHQIVLSMKASNTQVMVQAYRLLVAVMIKEGMNYPLHLGVTEAGDGEDGRIKSAVGIGALLEDGLGDTIRVSLTEDPEFEIPVAKQLAARYSIRANHPKIEPLNEAIVIKHYSPFEFNKRTTIEVKNIGGSNVPRVIADYSKPTSISPSSLFAVGYNYNPVSDKWSLNDFAVDYIVSNTSINFEVPGTLGIIYPYSLWLNQKNQYNAFPLFNKDEFIKNYHNIHQFSTISFLLLNTKEIDVSLLEVIKQSLNIVLIIETDNLQGFSDIRKLFFLLDENQIKHPVIIKRNYNLSNFQEFQLYSSTDFGAHLIDGMGDGVWASVSNTKEITRDAINKTLFGILQATRSRISKTEYISCPSCGRTLFDLQETTQKIRKVTDHLKGIKIGIMGCIVNGPGEMADADYGYVGTGVGKITLYKGKEVVKRNIDSEHAVEALINLIKEHGDWVERPTEMVS
jgi:(E)-4-hydroxy-3-methylbut-2-enyl-diphosphate synthase